MLPALIKWKDGLRYGLNRFRHKVSREEWEFMYDFYTVRLVSYARKYDAARGSPLTFACQIMRSAYSRVLRIRRDNRADAWEHGIPLRLGMSLYEDHEHERDARPGDGLLVHLVEESPEDVLIRAIDLKAQGIRTLEQLAQLGGDDD